MAPHIPGRTATDYRIAAAPPFIALTLDPHDYRNLVA